MAVGQRGRVHGQYGEIIEVYANGWALFKSETGAQFTIKEKEFHLAG